MKIIIKYNVARSYKQLQKPIKRLSFNYSILKTQQSKGNAGGLEVRSLEHTK